MRKTLTVLGATLIAAVTIQTAAASGRHHSRKAHPAPITQSVRNSNAAIWPSQPTAPRLVALRQRRLVGTGGTVM